MSVEIITKEDLNVFRKELLNELRELLFSVPKQGQKDWLKSTEVRKILGVSPNTLQNLRVSGKLKSSKVGGIHYYRFGDIQKLMESE